MTATTEQRPIVVGPKDEVTITIITRPAKGLHSRRARRVWVALSLIASHGAVAAVAVVIASR
jgi:hypothetical protein